MLIRLLPALLLVTAPGCGEDEEPPKGGGEQAAPDGEGEGEAPAPAPDPGAGEGEGEGEPGPAPDAPDRHGEACDATTPEPCGPGHACVRVAHAERAGTCLATCDPVDEGTCALPGSCAEGFACVNVRHFPIVAVNVCTPTCAQGDDSACFVGTTACAPEIEVDEELKFRCEGAVGANQYVCLP